MAHPLPAATGDVSSAAEPGTTQGACVSHPALNPDRPGDPASGDPALTVDLQLAAVSDAAAALRWVWLEYADDTGAGRWQDSWQPMDAGGGRVRFVRSDTRLTD